MKPSTIQEIWGEEYWFNLAADLEIKYSELLSQKGMPLGKITKEYDTLTEHRIERFIRMVSILEQNGNMHIGLTSSDLEDNIRIIRLVNSWQIINKKLGEFVYLTKRIISMVDGYQDAYTHLKKTRSILLSRRYNYMISALNQLFDDGSFGKRVLLKGLGGSIGDAKIQSEIGIEPTELGVLSSDWAYEHTGVSINQQDFCSQTVSHVSELYIAFLLSGIGMILSKWCNDIRQMIAFGQASITIKDIASTAIVDKMEPNPWKFEKASTLFTNMFVLPNQISHIGANCLLERTLTNQSNLNLLFERAFSDLLQALDLLTEGMQDIKFIVSTEDNFKKSGEYKLLKLVKSGRHNRLQAYKKLNKNTNL